MMECPQHSDSVDLVERVSCIYEGKSWFLRGRLFVPNILNPVDCAFCSRFNSGKQLVILIQHGVFMTYDLYHNLRKKLSPSFSDSDQTKSRLISKHNPLARHKCTIGHPGRSLVGYLVEKVSTLVRSLFLSSPDFKIHPCKASESVPPGPELPESFRATDLTAYFMISTGIKIGVSEYVSNA